MPHVLYNHLTHSWDHPDPDDGCSDLLHHSCESPDLSPAAQGTVSRLALAAGAAIGGLILWGMLAGVLLGVS